MIISVISPCRNERRHIREFLDSLLAQELDPGWSLEILIADGMSDDGTRDILREYRDVLVVDNPQKIVSTGLNAAIAASTGEIVIRMDGHTVYAKDYIRQCVRVLEESGADNVGGPWIAEGRGVMGRAIAAAFRSPFCAGGGKAHDPNYEGEADTVYLGCWRRPVFDRVGLFDPDLVRNQDDEFNFRLRRAGAKVWQSPRIQSRYTPRGSLSALFRQYAQYGFWRVAVMRKHSGLAAWRQAAPVLFVGSLLAGPIIAALAAAVGFATIAKLVGAFLAVELTVYLLACTLSSLQFVRSLELPALAAVPGVIVVYHLAYGLGFLMGLLRPARLGAPSAATSLTR